MSANPDAVVDIGRLPLEAIRLDGDVLHIGPLATLNDVAAHELVRDRFPVLRQAIHKSASAQLRNLATIGGNPLQSTRCPYFRSESPTPCNKRQPGSGCAARYGIADNHAIFGWTDDCVAVQPSDPATALVALDSTLVTADQNGGRRLAIRDLHTLPAEDPTVHHVLRAGEIIVDIEIGGAARASAYVKVRERESYEYALVSAAVALDLDGDLITRARIAVGSVAMKPWRLEAGRTIDRGNKSRVARDWRVRESGVRRSTTVAGQPIQASARPKRGPASDRGGREIMTAVGDGIARLDGPEKVTGHAQYAADFHLEGQAHAVLVGASVPSGRVKTVDTSRAEHVPGLLRVLSAGDFPVPAERFGLLPVPPLATRHLPLQDDVIVYHGQPVAMIVAETLEAAQQAAAEVRVEIQIEPSVNPERAQPRRRTRRGMPRLDRWMSTWAISTQRCGIRRSS